MKDKQEALTEIRVLCNQYLDNDLPKPKRGFWDLIGRRPTKAEFLLGRIEWICRHALEDYGSPSKSEGKEKL